jgi:hypothetical protein
MWIEMAHKRSVTGTDGYVLRLSTGERYAVSILRRLLLGMRSASVPGVRIRSTPGRSWILVVSRFRRVRKSLTVLELVGGATEQSSFPADREHRLLRALAAVQAGAANLVTFYLRNMTTNYETLALLTAAIVALARELAGRGYRLPQLSEFQPVPAAALRGMRNRGRDLLPSRVAWPDAMGSRLLS